MRISKDCCGLLSGSSLSCSRRLASLGWLLVVPLPLVAAAAAPQTTQAPQAPQSSTSPFGHLLQGRTPINRESPVLFKADSLAYDHKTRVWTAIGHVVFAQDNRTLRADQVTYNEGLNLVTASGHVRLEEPALPGSRGEIIEAEYVELTGDLKEGLLKEVRFLMADQSRLASRTAQRSKGGLKTSFEHAVYSPCYPCCENPNSPPLWDIKARYVEQDTTRNRIDYIDTQLNFKGTPLFYLPYFYTPFKPDSGFLAPYGGASSALGVYGGIPYYWRHPQGTQDLVTRPFISAKKGVLVFLEHRLQTAKGRFDTTGSFNVSRSEKVKAPTPGLAPERLSALRGHLNLKGQMDINTHWRGRWDGTYVSDKTYFRTFRDLSPFAKTWPLPYVTSELAAERFSQGPEEGYLRISGQHYRGLQEADQGKTTPLVLPDFWYNQTSRPLWKGSYSTFYTTARSVYRREGNRYQRLIMQGGWRLPYTTSGGHRFLTFGNLRVDGYHTHVTPLADPSSVIFQGTRARAQPQMGVAWRYPLWVQGFLPVIVEPVVQIVTATNNANMAEFPPEDAAAFELGDHNLLMPNPFPGHDRLASGSRVVYGTEFHFLGGALPATSVFLGQLYQLNRPAPDLKGSGMSGQLSDVVGRVQSDPHPWVSLNYRFRFAVKTFESRIAEMNANVGPQVSRLGLTYISYKPKQPLITTPALQPRIEQLGFRLSSQFHKAWYVEATQYRDLRQGGILSHAIQLRFDNECLSSYLSFGRTFYQDRGIIKPDTTISFSISLRNLGSANYTKQLDPLNPRDAITPLPGNRLFE